MLRYAVLQTYTAITQDNWVANAAPVPAAMLISLTPSPQTSLLQSGDMPT